MIREGEILTLDNNKEYICLAIKKIIKKLIIYFY